MITSLYEEISSLESQLAALREELSNTMLVAKSEIEGLSKALQDQSQRLTTAEQRNTDMIKLLNSIKDPQSIGEAFANAVKVRKFLGPLIFAEDANQTESGASE